MFIQLDNLHLQNKSYIMEKRMSKDEVLTMFDNTNKIYFKVKLSDNKKYWEMWKSKSKRKWDKIKSFKSLDEVFKSKSEIIDNNYRNLMRLIIDKKK